MHAYMISIPQVDPLGENCDFRPGHSPRGGGGRRTYQGFRMIRTTNRYELVRIDTNLALWAKYE